VRILIFCFASLSSFENDKASSGANVGTITASSGLHENSAPQVVTSTLASTNQVVGYSPAEAPAVAFSKPREDDQIAEVLSRPMLVSTTTVSFPLTQSGTQVYNPLTDFLNSLSVSNRLAYVRHLKATVCVRVEMPVNAHMYGEAHLALAPYLVNGNGLDSNARHYQLPHSGIFNANTGNPVVLKYPHFWMRSKIGLQNTWDTVYVRLLVSGLSPLGRDDAVAVGTPAFNVYVWLEDVEVSDSTPYLTYSGNRPKGGQRPVPPNLPGQPAYRGPPPGETAPGPLTQATRIISYAMRTMTPQTPVAKFIGDIAHNVHDLAEQYGWSKPNRPNEATFTMVRSAPFLGQGIGKGNAVSLTGDPNVQRALNPDQGAESEDVLAFAYWRRKWGWLGAANYATTTAVGAIICAIPVTPLIVDSVSGVAIPTAMCALAASRWVGGMEYRMSVAATPYHRGKLLVAYIPSVTTSSAVSMYTALQTCHCVVLDITQSTDMSFVIGWTQSDSAAVFSIGGANYDVSNGNIPGRAPNPRAMTTSGSLISAASGGLIGTNGQLVVFALDALSATAAGSLVVNFWARAGPDLQFSGYGGMSVLSYVTTAGDRQDNRTDVVAHDFAQEAFQIGSDVKSVWLGGGPVETTLSARLWGDELISFRPLLKRYFAGLWFTPWSSGSSNGFTNQMAIRVNMPTYPPVTRLTADGQPWNTTSNPVVSCYFPSIWSLLASAFVGMGGSMDQLISLEPEFAQNNDVHLSATLADTDPGYMVDDIMSTTFGPTVKYMNNTFAVNSAGYGPNGYYGRYAMGAEVDRSTTAAVNSTYLNVHCPHPSTDSWVAPADGHGNSVAPFAYDLTLISSSANLRGAGVTVYYATGEDFQFFGFIGCPTLGQPTGTNRLNAYNAFVTFT